MTDAIEIEDLHKSYGDLAVLRGLSLRVGVGEVYGLLGPNGSGKSTLIHTMLGLLRPAQGRLRILGSANLDQQRARIGYIPERQRYHTRYTAREYLRFMGKFSGLGGADLRERVDRELNTVGLGEAADRMLATFSKGMLQRLGVAQALLIDPDLLLIDEPTSGLDPAGQREVLDLLSEVRERGHTVFLCTHYLHEVEQLCDRVGVLSGGRIATEASVRDLRTPGGSIVIEVRDLPVDLRRQIEGLGRGVRADSQRVRISPNTPELQAAVLRALLDAGAAIIALEPLESAMEQLYLRAVSGALPPPLPDLPPITIAPPDAIFAPVERRAGTGDTLLNELLRNNQPAADIHQEGALGGGGQADKGQS